MTNRTIDLAVFTQKWMIDHDWGLQQLLKYHEDLALADTHGLESLNYKEMRAAIEPKMFMGGDFYTGSIAQFEGNDAIAVLTLEGVMRVEDGLCTYGVDTLVSDLNAAFNHPGIKGIVLKINSGGGATTAGALLRSALTNAPKPVVGLSYLMASGALYGTLPLKHILATDPMALVGSIGVVYQISKKMAEWYKENVDDIYATKSFQKNEGWNAYLRGDRSIFERDADEMATIFGDAVSESRSLTPVQAKTALTGKLFTAAEALQLGLITGYGNLNDAFNLVIELADKQKEQNTSDMALNAKFVKLLNTFVPGLSLKEGASVEEAQAALEAVPETSSVEGLNASVQQLTTDLATANDTISQLATTIEGLSTSLTELQNTVAGMQTQMESFATSEQLSEVQAGLANAEQAATKTIAKVTATPKATNNGNPVSNVEKFQQQLEAADIEGDSKY